MSDAIFHTLRKYRFPDVIKPTLLQIEKLVCQKTDSAPGIGKKETLEEIIDEFLFQRPRKRNVPHKRLDAIEELHFLELVLMYFQTQASDVTQQQMFAAIFDNYSEPYKRETLCKLVSMAVGTASSEVLNACGAWMQAKSCQSEVVSFLAGRLIHDYLGLSTTVPSCVRQLPTVSPLFTCNLTAALTHLHMVGSVAARRVATEIPGPILEVVTDWVSCDPSMCLSSILHSSQTHKINLWTSPSKPNTMTPVPGLARWCIHGPFNSHLLHTQLNNKQRKGQTDAVPASNDLVWSRLHAAVLETILCFASVPGANMLELFTIMDMNMLVKNLVDNYAFMESEAASVKAGEVKSSQATAELSQLSVDRLLQILQVSLMTGAFRSSLGDLKRIFSSIPPCPLLSILERHHFASGPPPMHFN